MYKAVLHKPVEENERDVVRGNYETVLNAVRDISLKRKVKSNTCKRSERGRSPHSGKPIDEDLASVIDENEMHLYEFFNSLKNFYKNQGFMDTMEYSSFIRLLTETITIEILVEEEIEEEDYETE